MSKLTIVILNYNGQDFLARFLPTVILHSAGYQIVVADNGSTDDSVSFLKNNFPQLELIEFAENYGFCGGYNKALNKIESEYYLLLNSDIEVSADWIAPMEELLDTNKKIGAVQPKILSWHQKDRFEYAGAAGGYIDTLGYPFCRGRIFEITEIDHGQYDKSSEIFWATGACLLIRSELFHRFGGFDEYLFAHMEEIDLCWKLQKHGFASFYCPKSVVWHVGGGTLPKNNARKTFLNFRNSMVLLIKHLPFTALLWKLPLRWMLDILAFINYILKKSPKNAIAIIQAHMDIILNLSLVFESRSKEKIKGMPRNGRIKGSIVWLYYFQKKRKFSELDT